MLGPRLAYWVMADPIPASFNERLLLNNGLCVSPMKTASDGPQPRSLRELVHQIDNDRDLKTFIVASSTGVPPKRPEIRYERHPVRHGMVRRETGASR